MRKFVFRVIKLLFCFVILWGLTVSVGALDTDHIRVPITEQIDLPSEFDVEIRDTCSGHDHFMQAAAQEDGAFLVYSRNLSDAEEPTFQRVYIDIYRPDGSFLQEVSFTSSFSMAVEMVDDLVIVYFYPSVYVFDISTQQSYYYSSPEDLRRSSEMFAMLMDQPFESGGWTYICDKSFPDNYYTKLIRTHGAKKQVLVEMDGTGEALRELALPVLLGMACILLVSVLYRRVKRRSRTEDGPQSRG